MEGGFHWERESNHWQGALGFPLNPALILSESSAIPKFW